MDDARRRREAPGAPDEDTAGGFEHGGWSLTYFDEAAQKWALTNITEADGFLLGRRTYEVFAAHWPNASEEEQVIAEPLNITCWRSATPSWSRR